MPLVNNRAHRNPGVVLIMIVTMVFVLVMVCIAFLQIKSRLKVSSLDQRAERGGEIRRLVERVVPVDLSISVVEYIEMLGPFFRYFADLDDSLASEQ